MIRAGVFIGVDRSGNLHPLQDAASGAERMYKWMCDWAAKQGFPPQTYARLITDANGQKVGPYQIYDEIANIIENLHNQGPGLDQLIVYFAGHGVNINRNEHWLLSDAPANANAAVNVSGSVELAKYCGVRHVVFISDACRVATKNILYQRINGCDVFPNQGGGKAKPVDQFYACLLGSTAAEIKDQSSAANEFRALYTDVMLDALKGIYPEAWDRSDDPTDTAVYVKPVKLEQCLETRVPQIIRSKGLMTEVTQEPDAFIIAHPYWLSRLDPPPPVTRGDMSFKGWEQRSSLITPSSKENIRTITKKLISSAIEGDYTRQRDKIWNVKNINISGIEQLINGVEGVFTPFGPDHFETQCGIKVRGTRIIDYFAHGAYCKLLGNDGKTLQVDLRQESVASIILNFEGGFGAVLPVINGFLTAITIVDEKLIDVAYEPSVNTNRWHEYSRHATKIRRLRAVASVAAQQSRFRIEAMDVGRIAKTMHYAEKSLDPSLALYAAYAYHDLQEVEHIRRMSGELLADIGITLFDIALLGRILTGKEISSSFNVVPFVPLLSQGWALLGANGVQLHSVLKSLERTMRDSVWSLYNSTELEMLKQAIQTGDFQ